MVKPASSVAEAGLVAPRVGTDNPSNPKGLQGVFHALLARHALPSGASSGLWAYEAQLLTQRGERGVTPGSSSGRRPGAVAVQDDLGSALDPLNRSLALPGLTPTGLLHAPLAPPGTRVAGVDVAALEEAVRRVSWGGDARRGVARIELGGEYAGTAVVIRGEGRELSLRLELGRGADARGLTERLVARLTARGLRVTDVEIG